MLNELRDLAEAVRAAGIATTSWHKHMKRCPSGATFVLYIGETGSMDSVEWLTNAERVAGLRKFEVAAGESFPTFNICPLYHRQLGKGERHEGLESLSKSLRSEHTLNGEAVQREITSIAEDFTSLWDEREKKRLKRCLHQAPGALFRRTGPLSAEAKALDVLRERAARIDVDTLPARLGDLFVGEMLKGRNEARTILGSFFFSTGKTARKLSCVLELPDWNDLGLHYPANHPNILRELSSLLRPGRDAERDKASGVQMDAYGDCLDGHDESFDAADLPRLGKVSLWAMSSESLCQKRYGKGESRLFPVGHKTRQSMKDALEWLGKPERMGRTWEIISRSYGKRKKQGGGRETYEPALLFAYPTVLPATPPEIAALFGGDGRPEDRQDDRDGARFESMAARVAPAVRGILRERPDAEIRVFALGKADKARTKLLASRHYSAEGLLEAAEKWQRGCRNLPAISLNLGSGDSADLALWTQPLIPFPTEVVKCLNIAWSREGERGEPTRSLDVGDAIDLVMGEGMEMQSLIQRCMHLASHHAAPLLLALGHADHRRDGAFQWGEDKSKGQNNGRYRVHGNYLPSILGMLLDKLNIGKEAYMHSAPFLVGRMCSLADLLHREYCTHVRSGRNAMGDEQPSESADKESQRSSGMPRQLMGNAAMSVALGSPVAGLARLADRILIYQCWANTAPGNETGLAKWALGRYGRTADELAGLALPETCGDPEKAQMLLGYLARIEGESE